MRKLNVFLAGAAIFGMMSCADDDNSSNNNNNNNNSNVSEIIETVKDGSWRITTFDEDGNNETGHFSGYNFTFDDNGILTATNGDSTYNGTWAVTNDSSSSDDDNNSGSDIDFDINFSAPAHFEDLSDDWDIEERTDTKIRLIDVSGGNGGTDRLVFEKN